MKLQAFVSLMLFAGGLPSALARMPFEAGFGARVGPSLAKEPPPSSSAGFGSTTADKASSTRTIVDKLDQSLGNQEASAGNAGQ